MKPHTFHPAADAEYTEAATYYAGIDAEPGNRFYDEMERLISEIRKQPERFWMFDPPRAADSQRCSLIRSCIWTGLIVWIVAVMHGKQRPGYWRSRTL